MAIKLKSAKTMANVGTSLTMPAYPSDLAADDFILVLLGKDGSAGTWAESGSSDFTACPNNAASDGTIYTAGFYFKATGSSETPRVFDSGSSDQCGGYVLVFSGVHTTSPFDDSDADDFAGGAGGTWTPTALTTTGNNRLLLWFGFGDGGRGMLVPDGMMGIMPPGYAGDPTSAGGGANAVLFWTVQPASGTSITPAVKQMSSDTGQILSFALTPADATDAPPYCDDANPPLSVIHPLRGDDTAGPFNGGAFDPGVATINTHSTTYDAIQLSSGAGLGGLNDAVAVIASSAETGLHYGGWSCNTTDLSGEVITISMAVGGQGRLFDTIANDGFIFGLRDTDGDCMFWNLGGVDSVPILDAHHQAIVIDVDGGYEIDEYNTFNSAAVNGLIWGSNRPLTGSTTSAIIGEACVLNRVMVVGGHSGDPCTMQTFQDSLSLTFNQNIPTKSQSMMKLGIGDGSTKTYWKDSNAVMEPYPSVTGKNRQMQVGDTFAADLQIYTSASDTIDLRNQIWKGNGSTPWTIHASSSSSATFLTSGLKLIGRAVTLQDVFSSAGGITFTDCPEVTHNAADLSGGCTFDGCTGTQAITLTGATEAALQTAVDNIANCNFSNSGTYGLKVKFTGTGDISLSFDGITCDELLYDADDSGSTLTVVLTNGSTVSNTNVVDDETVTLSNDKTITVNISVTGSEVTLLEHGTQTEIDHSETATTTYSYTYTYSSDTAADLQVYKPGYKPYWNASVTLGNADQSITVDLEAEPAYES